MAIIGSSQPFNQQSLSVQGQRPANVNVIYSGNTRVDQQRVAIAQRKKAVNEYNAAVAQYNIDLAAYNKAVKEQTDLQNHIRAQNADFSQRAQTGNLSVSEFAQTTYAQNLSQQYGGGNQGSDAVQAAYYGYLLSFQNPNYKAAGASNRADLEYARASAIRSLTEKYRLQERTRLANEPGYYDRLSAQQTLVALSKKPVLTAQDIPRLNQARDVLGLSRPDYTGTITRRDGSKENYRNGDLVSVKNNQSRKDNGAGVPVVSASQIPSNFTGTVILNTPNSPSPKYFATYRNGQLVAAKPVR